MAQYYHLVGQTDQTIQAVTIEELRQYYPNLTCVETSPSVQYVINQDDATVQQFQSQQVLLATDQQIVLNQGEASQPVIVDQSQLAFQQGQTFIKQDGDLTEYQEAQVIQQVPQPQSQVVIQPPQQVVVQQTQQQVVTQQVVGQQVYYSTNSDVVKQQFIQRQQQPQAQPQQQVQVVGHLVPDQQQIVGQQIITTGQRVITHVVSTEQVGHMMTQVNNTQVVQQGRVAQIQQSPQQTQIQQTDQTFKQQTTDQNDTDQVIRTSDGRVMTIAQLKQEISQEKSKTPVRKRSPPKPRNNTNRGRGGNIGRGRGNYQTNCSPTIQRNTMSPTKTFQQRPIQYNNRQLQNQPLNQQRIIQQQIQQNMVRIQHQAQLPKNPIQTTNQIQQPVNQTANQIQQTNRIQPTGNQVQPVNQVQQTPNQIPSTPNRIQQTENSIQPSPNHIQPSPNQIQPSPNQIQPSPNQIQSQNQIQASPNQLQQTLHQEQSPQLLQHPQRSREFQQQYQQQIQRQQQQRQQQQRQQLLTPTQQNQPLIPLTPTMYNGNVQRSFSPQSNHNQVHQLLEDSCSSSVSDEYKDSLKMLVCLENGEQRLITFTLPKDSCTVQDLLEQVGVPFSSDTKIECVTNTGMRDIDYIVSVGAVTQPPTALFEAQQVLTVDNLSETQECLVSQSNTIISMQPEVSESESIETQAVVSQEKPQHLQQPVEPELPRLVPGYLALCKYCGYLSEHFNRCQRCRTKMPDEPKAISMEKNVAKQQAESNKDKQKTIITSTPNKCPSPGRNFTPKSIRGASGRGRGRGRGRIMDIEPVILTLSSDEEDTPSKTPVMTNKTISKMLDNSITLQTMEKEPVYKDNMPVITDESIFQWPGSTDDDSKLYDLHTTLQCRTVRIGTFKFVPREEIVITSIGIKILAPLVTDMSRTYPIFIPSKQILKVLVNFQKSLPVLFFYILPSAGTHVRNKLLMREGSDIYFDPLSKQDPFKRITLLPELISEETRNIILEIFSTRYFEYTMIEELTLKEANDILIRTCPRERTHNEQQPVLQPMIQSANSSALSMDPKQLLIYPPPPAKGGITINVEDYLCLGQDQFLNDAIIDFYLKYLQTEVLAPPMQDRVHMFSSFFYKRLTTKPVKASKRLNPFEIDPSLTPAQKRHCRVKKWTKNVNIFEKDFVIIPINENSHWFLAIICFPGLDGARAYNDDNKIIKVPPKQKKGNSKEKTTSVVIGNTTITLEKNKLGSAERPIKCDDEELSDRDEAEGDDSELEESSSDTETDNVDNDTDKKTNKVTREAIKQPCILIFDSLAGAGRSRVVATLRDYLTCEHRTKLSSTKSFTKENIKGACPKVPQQMNFTDCGLYVLQYVEAFFRKPIQDYHIPIKELKNWFKEIVVTRKREEIAFLIRDLMTELKKDVSVIPDITFPTLNGKLVSSNNPEEGGTDEEMDMDEQELEEAATGQQSLVSEAYNSDDSDETKQSEMNISQKSCDSASTTVNSIRTTAGPVLISTLVKPVLVPDVNKSYVKSDLSELTPNKTSNRETMSYLKAKRIHRHKNNNNPNDSIKKQKLSE